MLRISAKDLGALAMEGFCPRCFWIERHSKSLPYETGFPGIFSSIDSFTKNVVEGHFEKYGTLPEWMSQICRAKAVIKVNRKDFNLVKGDVILTGMPDEVLEDYSEDLVIVDYKTARYTGNQDRLMPIYEIQLNGYAAIAEKVFNKSVKSLYLIYFEPPVSSETRKTAHDNANTEGFSMQFKPSIHKVGKNINKVFRLMKEAGDIYDGTKPERLPDCSNCTAIAELSDISKD